MSKRPISELKAELQKKEAEILKRLIDVSYVMALNFKAFADHQIKTKGIPGEKYSENPLPPHWLEKNAKTAYGRKAIQKEFLERGSVSYKDLRRVENLQTDFVDYTFSGETLRNWGIVSSRPLGNDRYVSFLGGTTDAAKKKLSYAKSMYGANMWARVVGQDGQKLLREILEKEFTKIKTELGL